MLCKNLNSFNHVESHIDDNACNKILVDEVIDENIFAVNLINTETQQLYTWHRRLDHPPFSILQHIKCQDVTHSLSKEHKRKFLACEACHKAKQTRFSFPSRTSDASQIFELIHIDIWGTYSASSITHTNYMLIIVNDHSSATWTYLMHHKSQTFSKLYTFIKMVKT